MRDYEVDIENCGREIEQQSKELNEKKQYSKSYRIFY